MAALVGCERCKHSTGCEIYLELRAIGGKVIAQAAERCTRFETADYVVLRARERKKQEAIQNANTGLFAESSAAEVVG